jgi:hypothetical protein
VKLIERHRPNTRARFVTVGLPNILREQFLSALELQRTEDRAGLAKTPSNDAAAGRRAA